MSWKPQPGQVVRAIKDGGLDDHGLPLQRPLIGEVYRLSSIYRMSYGLGCTLVGMDPAPYRGYFLFVKKPKTRTVLPGWYFEPFEAADEEWTATLYELLRSKNHDENQLRTPERAYRTTLGR